MKAPGLLGMNVIRHNYGLLSDKFDLVDNLYRCDVNTQTCFFLKRVSFHATWTQLSSSVGLCLLLVATNSTTSYGNASSTVPHTWFLTSALELLTTNRGPPTTGLLGLNALLTTHTEHTFYYFKVLHYCWLLLFGRLEKSVVFLFLQTFIPIKHWNKIRILLWSFCYTIWKF